MWRPTRKHRSARLINRFSEIEKLNDWSLVCHSARERALTEIGGEPEGERRTPESKAPPERPREWRKETECSAKQQ